MWRVAVEAKARLNRFPTYSVDRLPASALITCFQCIRVRGVSGYPFISYLKFRILYSA